LTAVLDTGDLVLEPNEVNNVGTQGFWVGAIPNGQGPAIICECDISAPGGVFVGGAPATNPGGVVEVFGRADYSLFVPFDPDRSKGISAVKGGIVQLSLKDAAGGPVTIQNGGATVIPVEGDDSGLRRHLHTIGTVPSPDKSPVGRFPNRTITDKHEFPAPPEPGTYTLQICVTDTSLTGCTDCDFVVVGPPDLAIHKSAFPDPVLAGGTLTYTLQVTNKVTGAGVATGIFVIDTLPAPLPFVTALDESQEIPATGSAATGFGGFTLNRSRTELAGHLKVDTAALSGPITGAHIHNAFPGVNGPIVRTLNFVGDDSAGTWTAGDPEPLTPALVNELLAGYLYVNVHTEDNPGGEIRGQTLPNPAAAGVTFVSAVASQGAGCSEVEGAVTCGLGDLQPGATATVTIVVTVDPTTPDGTVLTNTASVTSTSADPNAGNDTTTTRTRVGQTAPVVSVYPVGPASVLGGATVQYEIQASGVLDLAAAQAIFNCDPALWAVYSIELGPDLDGCLNAFNDSTPGATNIALVCSDSHTGTPLTLWLLGLTAVEVAQDQATQFGVTQVTLGTLAEDDIPAQGTTLDVTITSVVCGDVHPAGGGDGDVDVDVDVLDALRTLKIGVKLVTPDARESIAGDVNPATSEPAGDGDIDVLDALRVLKTSVGAATMTSCGGPV